jgi:hypothetical protein
MIAAYYDRTGYPDMYTGPENGGVMPMDNGVWGHTNWPRCDVSGDALVSECPLSATQSGVDGRTTRGHVDDYWIGYACSGPDPYVTNGWIERAPEGSTADFMKTNKWFPDYSFNVDGSTTFFFDTSGGQTPTSALIASGPPWSYDGGVGIEQFYQSRGYTVSAAFNQYIQGAGSNPSLGFTYDQYKAEIDGGRPVMIHLQGHTVVGVGYDDSAGEGMLIHDTWDYAAHTMTWGERYLDMAHLGITVVQLEQPSVPAPTVTSITPNSGFYTETVHITDLSGSNFQSGATVNLMKSGEDPITATNTTVVSTSTITCDLDLTGAATGWWDVVVTNPDSLSGTLPGGFRIRSGDDHSLYLPLVTRQYPPTEAGWVTILEERFEGSFPGGEWEVRDNDSSSGRYYWGKRDCRDNGGSFSAWSVGAGDTTLSCGSDYRNDVYAWMIYGPFSLADATASDLTFDWWSDTELEYDVFGWAASVDGVDYYGTIVSGDWSSWTTGEILDLGDVPILGNLVGEDQVWIAFVFASNTIYTDRGSFVDNVLLRKYVGSGASMERARPAPQRLLERDQTLETATLRLN